MDAVFYSLDFLTDAIYEGRLDDVVGVLRANASGEPLLSGSRYNWWQPIHYAVYVQRSDQRIVRALLASGRWDVNLPTRQGNTPLHLAALALNPGVIEELVLWGANPMICNKSGDNVADYAHGIEKINFMGVIETTRRLPWSRELHKRLPPAAQETVLTVLLCAHRIRTPKNGNNKALPALPQEMWLAILGCVRAVCLMPFKQSQQWLEN